MMEREEDDRAHNHLTEDLEGRDGIRAAHINCNGLKNKLDEVELVIMKLFEKTGTVKAHGEDVAIYYKDQLKAFG